ncbi:MAG: hypothetical protein Q9194_007006 [Teloschistes cf. exilis]
MKRPTNGTNHIEPSALGATTSKKDPPHRTTRASTSPAPRSAIDSILQHQTRARDKVQGQMHKTKAMYQQSSERSEAASTKFYSLQQPILEDDMMGHPLPPRESIQDLQRREEESIQKTKESFDVWIMARQAVLERWRTADRARRDFERITERLKRLQELDEEGLLASGCEQEEKSGEGEEGEEEGENEENG